MELYWYLKNKLNANMTVFYDTAFVEWWKHTYFGGTGCCHLQDGIQLTLSTL